MRRRPFAAQKMIAELGAASAETIARRMALMATGLCSRVEYRKMVQEKVTAAQYSWIAAAMFPWTTMTAMIAPWHRASRRNARRLRAKR